MDKRLSRLITDYQNSVRNAVALMYRSGIQLPFSSADWIENDIPWSGTLVGNVEYFKHGVGCRVQLEAGAIDFDFGRQGEICGVDEWRLVSFANKRVEDYGFRDVEEIKQCFEVEVILERLVQSGCCLYYVANLPRIFAIDVDCRLPGDLLPNRHQDSVLSLYAYNFLAADLMRKKFEKLQNKLSQEGRLSQTNQTNLATYLAQWLGCLRAVCEGFEKPPMRLLLRNDRPNEFKELIPKADEVTKMMNLHYEPLRKLRNDIFHPRKSPESIRRFFAHDVERLAWARNLHSTIKIFFNEYRGLCLFHYLINDRKGDLWGRTNAKRNKRN